MVLLGQLGAHGLQRLGSALGMASPHQHTCPGGGQADGGVQPGPGVGTVDDGGVPGEVADVVDGPPHSKPPAVRRAWLCTPWRAQPRTVCQMSRKVSILAPSALSLAARSSYPRLMT